MAEFTGTVTQFNGNTGRYTLILRVTETSSYVSTNKSNVYWWVGIRNDNIRNNFDQVVNFEVSINGQNVCNYSPRFVCGNGNTVGIADGNITIEHSSDGSKTISCSASLSGDYVSSYSPKSASCGGNLKLTTIARATQPNIDKTTALFGDTLTISGKGASSTFTHKISVLWNGVTTFLSDIENSFEYKYSTTTDWIKDIPNASKGTVSFLVDTYNGTSKIGSKTVSCELSVPDNYVPTISDVLVTDLKSDISSKFNCFVQSKSALRFQVKASGVSDSTITNCTINFNGQIYTGLDSSTQVVKDSGEFEINVKITDSRSRTATFSKQIKIYPYYSPQITYCSVGRANTSGNYSDDGEFALCEYAYDIAPINDKNDASFKIQTFDASDETWKDLIEYADYKRGRYEAADETKTVNLEKYLSSIKFDKNYAFKFRFAVSDFFNTFTIEKEMQVSYALINFGADGKSIAFGKQSSNEGKFEVAMDAIFQNLYIKEKELIDYIHPVGSIYMTSGSEQPKDIFGGEWEEGNAIGSYFLWKRIS